MDTNQRRLRKYYRKKVAAFKSRNPNLTKYLTLYWRYHHKVYGKTVPLWDIINEGVIWPKPKTKRR